MTILSRGENFNDRFFLYEGYVGGALKVLEMLYEINREREIQCENDPNGNTSTSIRGGLSRAIRVYLSNITS